MQDVASRKQALNDEAYKSVLQTLFARSKTDMKMMMLMQKLRKELNITTEQHKAWLQQLQAAKQSGTLTSVLGQAGAGAVAPVAHQQVAHHHHHHQTPVAAAAAAGVDASGGTQRQRATTKRKRAVVMTEEDTASDNTFSAGDYSQQQQGWQQPVVQQQAYGQQAYQANGVHAQPHGGGGGDKKKKQPAAQPEIPADLPELIGHKVHRYWPKEGQWFEGYVTDYRSRDNLYCITYHLGKKNESMEWFDIDRAQAMGNPQLSHYQLTPEKLDMRRYSHTRAFQNSSVLNVNRAKKGGGSSKAGATGATAKATKRRGDAY